MCATEKQILANRRNALKPGMYFNFNVFRAVISLPPHLRRHVIAAYAADPEALSIMQQASTQANLKGTRKMLTKLMMASNFRNTQKCADPQKLTSCPTTSTGGKNTKIKKQS